MYRWGVVCQLGRRVLQPRALGLVSHRNVWASELLRLLDVLKSEASRDPIVVVRILHIHKPLLCESLNMLGAILRFRCFACLI